MERKKPLYFYGPLRGNLVPHRQFLKEAVEIAVVASMGTSDQAKEWYVTCLQKEVVKTIRN